MAEPNFKKPGAIANASPIICLSKASLLDLMGKLYSKVLVPSQVAEELDYGPHAPAMGMDLLRFNWIEVTPPIEMHPEIIGWNLGPGESAVISLALKIPEMEVLIDDRAASRCAAVYGLKTKGTLGILLDAKSQGIVAEIKPCLQKLIDAGLWISRDLERKILQIAGET